MSTAFEQPSKVSEVVVREPIDNTRARWIDRARSADHKVIGTTLIGFACVMLVLAGFMEILGQIQLAVSDNTFLSPERFYSLHTLSDTGLLYMFALPLFAGIATYVLPLQIGARSSAFPRLSALGTWMIILGGSFAVFSTFVNTWQGTVQTSAPLFELFYSGGSGADFWLTAMVLIGGGLTFNAIDLAVTYKTLRAEGMSGDRTPVFSYAVSVYAYGILVTAPVLVAICILALLERQYTSFGIFNPVDGGSPLLWKTLFQWWSHSAPYLITVVAIGAVSEIFAAASGRSIVNASALKKAIRAFAILGILSFGVVFFGAPVKPFWNLVFMVIGLALVIPAAVIFQTWIATLRSGDYQSTAPSAFAVAFSVFFAIAIVFHVALSLPALSQWIYGSQAGYASWLNQVWGTAGFGGFAALLYWFPKMTGKNVSAAKARVALGMLVIGTALQFFALFSLGVDGFARELSTYTSSSYEFRNILALIGLILGAFGTVGLLINLMQSNSSGATAGNDPWRAGTLEWFVPSPPPVNNFDAIPAVASETPLTDLRAQIAAGTGELAGSVAQSPTAGRPSLRESKH
ncbi:MAG: cbb3-type cytochrome c oxidase subunit I [Solirubrobacterales bacterium]|nr:cbb3-type cytochrome c oxidase subunit I [Solirubrobacterales bacterium]